MRLLLPALLVVEIPDGATHYIGEFLGDEPMFFKCTQVAGYDHWWFYDRAKKTWYLSGHTQPHWSKTLSDLKQADPFTQIDYKNPMLCIDFTKD